MMGTVILRFWAGASSEYTEVAMHWESEAGHMIQVSAAHAMASGLRSHGWRCELVVRETLERVVEGPS